MRVCACARDRASLPQALLDNGADPEATDSMGWTPLIYAAYGGHLAVTEIILDQGVEKREKVSALVFARERSDRRS